MTGASVSQNTVMDMNDRGSFLDIRFNKTFFAKGL